MIGIPNDPTNEARALLLLQSEGLIQLDNSTNLTATVLNISDNPKNLKFIETDAAMLPRSLDDVAVAVINANYALEAGFSPLKDALALESKDSPYANIIAIRIGDENRPEIQALKTCDDLGQNAPVHPRQIQRGRFAGILRQSTRGKATKPEFCNTLSSLPHQKKLEKNFPNKLKMALYLEKKTYAHIFHVMFGDPDRNHHAFCSKHQGVRNAMYRAPKIF